MPKKRKGIRKSTYIKPGPHETSMVYTYDKGKKKHIKTTKYKNASHIGDYKKLTGKTYFSPKTEREEEYNYKELKDPKAVFPKVFNAYMNLLEVFEGNDSEIIIEFGFDNITDKVKGTSKRTAITKVITKEVARAVKNLFPKLKRRLQPISWAKFWLYPEENKPKLHLWIKSKDGTAITIDLATIESIWTEGEVRLISITKSNREELASYFQRRNCNLDNYPPNIHVFEMSKDLEKIEGKEMERANAEEEFKLMEPIYQDSKPQTVKINGRKETFQVITYETFEQRRIKLSKVTKEKTYKGKKIKNQNQGGMKNE